MNGTFIVNSNESAWEANLTVNNETFNFNQDIMNEVLEEIANDDDFYSGGAVPPSFVENTTIEWSGNTWGPAEMREPWIMNNSSPPYRGDDTWDWRNDREGHGHDGRRGKHHKKGKHHKRGHHAELDFNLD